MQLHKKLYSQKFPINSKQHEKILLKNQANKTMIKAISHKFD